MSYEDGQRMGTNRKPMGQRYGDNGMNYSPSSNYNYGKSPNYGHNTNGNQQFHGQNPRRRNDRFRREPSNSTDRLVKQNDIIIRLLKEIRDRLPQRLDAPQNYADAERGFEPDSTEQRQEQNGEMVDNRIPEQYEDEEVSDDNRPHEEEVE